MGNEELEDFGYSSFSVEDPEDEYTYENLDVSVTLEVVGDKIEVYASEPYFRNGIRTGSDLCFQTEIAEGLTLYSLLKRIKWKYDYCRYDIVEPSLISSVDDIKKAVMSEAIKPNEKFRLPSASDEEFSYSGPDTNGFFTVEEGHAIFVITYETLHDLLMSTTDQWKQCQAYNNMF